MAIHSQEPLVPVAFCGGRLTNQTFPKFGKTMNITIMQLLFALVSISTAIYILNAVSYRVFLQKYDNSEFFESLRGLITVDFDHPNFPADDVAEIRKRQKTHDLLFYICVVCFTVCAAYHLAISQF